MEHTSGSMSVIVEDEIAIIGDSLSGFELKPFAKKKVISAATFKTWKKLADLECSSYIFAHGKRVLSHSEVKALPDSPHISKPAILQIPKWVKKISIIIE